MFEHDAYGGFDETMRLSEIPGLFARGKRGGNAKRKHKDMPHIPPFGIAALIILSVCGLAAFILAMTGFPAL